MKYYLYIYFLLLNVLALTACTQEEDAGKVQENHRIQLIAGVYGIHEVTRTSVDDYAYTLEVPTSDDPLNTDIWLSTTQGVYQGNTCGESGMSGNEIDSHRTISYINGNATTPSAISGEYLRYPAQADKLVYCIGLYPQNAWTASVENNLTKLTATIDGSKDLMFAPEISGSTNDPLVNKKQTYYHMLTWMKVRVRADEQITGETWGKLKKITVGSTSSLEITDLSNTTATYSGSTNITMFESEGYMLQTTSEEKGSVLLGPVNADGSTNPEYTLCIECENLSKSIPINLLDDNGYPFSGWTTGKVFVITLRFATLSYVEATVSLEDWDDEYRNLILQ